jgi:hypothetical protein
MDEQIERNGKTYRKMRVGELVQKGDIMNGILGWTEAFTGTSYEVANHGACYYREVRPEVKPANPAPIDDGGPAFARSGLLLDNGDWVAPQDGMTLRQYAAIKLRVPKSGLEWLDDMIRESQCNEFAGQALQGLVFQNDYGTISDQDIANGAYSYADAMLKARKEVLP